MIEKLEEMIDDEKKLESLVQQFSNEDKYKRVVFQGNGVYFAFVRGKILTISDDASCSPRGGWFPKLYRKKDGELYYQWEDEWINLYDNIVDIGKPDTESDAEDWIEILENIDENIVKAFNE